MGQLYTVYTFHSTNYVHSMGLNEIYTPFTSGTGDGLDGKVSYVKVLYPGCSR